LKGVVLAGGSGTRLRPMTLVTNKHLLPVYDKPMVFYPLETLKKAGLDDILIVTGPENAGDFLKLLGSGKSLGVRLTYRVQDEAGGIAQALGLAEHFVDGDSCAVILGDNIFQDDFSSEIKSFKSGGRIFLKEVSDPARFGVPEIRGGKIASIEEKPKQPKSSYAVAGLYLYDAEVFSIIKKLKPSHRGELEITDVNNYYLSKSALSHSFVKGFWSDAGTVDSLMHAAELVKQNSQAGKRQP